jgi:hypothetical protein
MFIFDAILCDGINTLTGMTGNPVFIPASVMEF